MGNRGFTLIELLIVIGIIGLLIGVALPTYSSFQNSAKETLCKKQLQTIGESLELYRHRFKHWPKEGGVRFVLAPWFVGEIDNDEKNAQIYVCPGTTEETDNEGGAAYDDPENVDPETVSYAGRDIEEYKISKKHPIKDAIVADANRHPEGNHNNKTNILWGDCRTVSDIDISDFSEFGETIAVGPDSPHEPLRKLSIY